MSDEQSIEEEIARTLSANWNNMHTNESLGRQRMLAKSLSPLLNRVRAEALREAANWMQIGIGEPYHPDEDALLRKHWHARRKYLYDRADRIEQNSEGSET